MVHTLILGIGNPLRGDDGAGLRVVDLLRESRLPPGVEVAAPGSTPLDLLETIASHERIIVVDAVRGNGEPGSIYCFSPEDAEIYPRRAASIHQLGLLETLAMAQHLGYHSPKVVIFGIEPKATDFGPELSPEVAAAIPQVVALVLEEARRPTLPVLRPGVIGPC